MTEQTKKENKIVPIVSQEVHNLATALSKAQGVITGAKKDKKNPFFKSQYADLESVFEAIRQPFADNGLSVTQTMDVVDGGRMVLCTRLMHASGQFIDSKMLLPQEANPQKLGALLTYYRRYMLMAIAGIPAADDDGNKASGKVEPVSNLINAKQVVELTTHST